MSNSPNPLVGIAMGSETDWEVMQHAHITLNELDIPHEKRVLSAHRTPDVLAAYAQEARINGIQVLIAGAGGGAAHLPGMLAAQVDQVPVIGVPVDEQSVPSVLLMPSGVPVNTMPPGKPGAINAALAAAQMLAIVDERIFQALRQYRMRMEEAVVQMDQRISDA